MIVESVRVFGTPGVCSLVALGAVCRGGDLQPRAGNEAGTQLSSFLAVHGGRLTGPT